MIVIGQNIQAARKRAKLTQAELAHKVGVSARHLQRIEKGEVDGLSIFDLDSIAHALGLESIDLMPIRPRQITPHAAPEAEALRAEGWDVLHKLANAPLDAQALVAALINNEPRYLLQAAPSFRQRWLQLLKSSLGISQDVQTASAAARKTSSK